MELENFTHNVAWLRKHYGISKKRMAQLIGIGVESLTMLKNGIIPPKLRIDVLLNIHKQFGITPEIQLQKRLGDSK